MTPSGKITHTVCVAKETRGKEILGLKQGREKKHWGGDFLENKRQENFKEEKMDNGFLF